MIKRLGIEAPEAATGNEVRHRKKIKNHIAMLDAIDRGEDKEAAAKNIGKYASWSRAKEYGLKYSKEIEAARHAKKSASQAVAD